MAVTGLGKRWARRIKEGTVSLLEVPSRYVNDVKDSFIELFGYSLEE